MVYVVIRCPEGHVCQVSREIHTIGTDGTLSPSWVCSPGKACSFHVFIRLKDWIEAKRV